MAGHACMHSILRHHLSCCDSVCQYGINCRTSVVSRERCCRKRSMSALASSASSTSVPDDADTLTNISPTP